MKTAAAAEQHRKMTELVGGPAAVEDDAAEPGVVERSAVEHGAGCGPIQHGTGRAAAGDQSLDAFAPDVRDRIARLTCTSRALADLTRAHPALLFALATGYGDCAQRAAALTALEAGQKLKHVSRDLGLPWWTRKLPAEALCAPLPDLRPTPDLDRAFANFVPTNAAVARAWLARIAYAEAACGSSFALWVARHHQGLAPSDNDERFRYETAWAWHSQHPDTALGRLIRRPWHERISPRRAVEEVVVWRRRINTAANLAICPAIRTSERAPAECAVHSGMASSDIATAMVERYAFQPLLEIEQVIDEATTMRNCLDQYGDALRDGRTLLISLRRRSRRLAVIELGFAADANGAAHIRQIKGPNNRSASRPLRQIAAAWASHTHTHDVASVGRRMNMRRRAALALWQPYLNWLPPAHACALELHLRAEERSLMKSADTADCAAR